MAPDRETAKKAIVVFKPTGQVVEVEIGTLLSDAAVEAGISLNLPCGGQGRCGRCRVKVEHGAISHRSGVRLTSAEIDEGWALLALALGLTGLVCLVPARPIPEMFALSDQWAAATTEAKRAIYQATGQAMLAHFHGIAYHAHYVLGSVSLLISSFLMLRSDTFRRATAYVGIATNIVVFGLYVPEIGVWLSMLSVVGYLIWYILIARRLIRLGWGGSQPEMT